MKKSNIVCLCGVLLYASVVCASSYRPGHEEERRSDPFWERVEGHFAGASVDVSEETATPVKPQTGTYKKTKPSWLSRLFGMGATVPS